MLCQQHWWLVSSTFLIIFFFWCFSLESLYLAFRSGVSLDSWLLVLLPSRLLNLTFSNSAFGCLSLCHFLKWADSFLPGWKLPSHSPSWFLFLGSPRYQPLIHELLVPKPFDSFLHHWVADRDISILVPYVSWHPFLNCLNPTLALLHIPRIPSSW